MITSYATRRETRLHGARGKKQVWSPLFETEVFRKQLCCVEESTWLLHCWDFSAPLAVIRCLPQWFGSRGIVLPCLPRYAPVCNFTRKPDCCLPCANKSEATFSKNLPVTLRTLGGKTNRNQRTELRRTWDTHRCTDVSTADIGRLQHKCNQLRLLATCSITIANKQNNSVIDYDYIKSNHDCNRDYICLETFSERKQKPICKISRK